MIEFSLSRSREKLLPDSVNVMGVNVPVDADFRTVLKCFRILDDPNMNEQEKQTLLHVYFFKDFQGFVIPDHIRLGLFCEFVNEEGQGMDTDPAPADYEQDADAIYASFLQQYGIDLIDVPFLHWRKFTALLSGLGENTAFNRRISLRELKTKDIKDSSERAKIERAQRRVALRDKSLTVEEERNSNELDKALESGDTDAALEILKRMRGE